MSHSTRKTVRIFLAVLALLGVIAYLAADRYLIRHVEIESVSAYSGQVISTQTVAEATASPARSTQTAVSTATSTAQPMILDDWNYSDGSVSISIRQVSSGSGRNALVYFVADVILSDATGLQSAFANDQFGLNIIEKTSVMAEKNGAIFAINGDYYGFRTDGIVIRNGLIFRDEPARVGLAFYRDGGMQIYDETSTTAQQLLDSGVWNTLSFGPALLVDSVIPANLSTVEVDTNFGNHSIQGNQPRTGLGMISPNHFVFVVVDGRSAGYSVGMTLPVFAQLFKDLGCTDAYNIDGGGSSTLYFNGRVVNNPLGKNRERGTSDILFISAQG